MTGQDPLAGNGEDPDEVLQVSLTRHEANLLHGKLLRALEGGADHVFAIRFVQSGGDVQIFAESDDQDSLARDFGLAAMRLIKELQRLEDARREGAS